MAETEFDPVLLGGGKPNAGENLVIIVARPEFGYYVNIIVTNTSTTTADSARVAVVPAGYTPGDENYICYDTEIAPSYFFTLANVGLGPQDQVIAYSTNGLLTFNVTGNKFFEI